MVTGTRRRTMDAILDAADRAFAELGYDAATMDAIAARAEVARATLYNNFASKDELTVALAERYRAKGYAAHLKRKAEGADVLTQLREFFRFAAEWTAENREVAMLGTIAALRGAGRGPARPGTLVTLQELVLEGRSKGTLRQDLGAEALTQTLGAVLLQMALLGMPAAQNDPRLWADALLDIVLEGICTPVGRRRLKKGT